MTANGKINHLLTIVVLTEMFLFFLIYNRKWSLGLWSGKIWILSPWKVFQTSPLSPVTVLRAGWSEIFCPLCFATWAVCWEEFNLAADTSESKPAAGLFHYITVYETCRVTFFFLSAKLGGKKWLHTKSRYPKVKEKVLMFSIRVSN